MSSAELTVHKGELLEMIGGDVRYGRRASVCKGELLESKGELPGMIASNVRYGRRASVRYAPIGTDVSLALT